MVRFNEANGFFYSTDQGRIASHFYIKYDTVEVINENFRVRHGTWEREMTKGVSVATTCH